MIVWVFLTFLLFNGQIEDDKMSMAYNLEAECEVALQTFRTNIPNILEMIDEQDEHWEDGEHEFGWSECIEVTIHPPILRPDATGIEV